MTRTHWLFVGCVGAALVFVAAQPAERPQYTVHPPPDTVAYRPAKLDSITRAVFRCFGKTATVRWFVTDSALGMSDAAGHPRPAQGRYFPHYGVIVMQRGRENDPALVYHELLHPTTGRVNHPPAIFAKAC